MDYLFLLSLARTTLFLITISYDIACEYSRNIWSRMYKMPSWLHIPDSTKIRFRVPKFHLPAHVAKCWAPFSFNFTKWVGRTDGEGVERNWSWLNGIARCVSMMGPGGRWDTLDDFCNYHNWRKTTGAGTSVVLHLPTALIDIARRPIAPEADPGHPGMHHPSPCLPRLHGKHANRAPWDRERLGETGCRVGE